MPLYKKSLWQKGVEDLFDGDDRDAVLDWLAANEGRRRVVLVGSGFTKNATLASGKSAAAMVPLWKQVEQAMADDLRVTHGDYDALTLADFYLAQLKGNALHNRLLTLMPDELLHPGPAHEELARYEAEAIITTNFLDTVLEKVPAEVAPVISDPDLALPKPTDASQYFRQLLYFHGHRSNFSSWVLARSHYEDLATRRPMLYAKVRQLFAQYPLLVVGYSLTDPDFHLMYRDMVRSMERRHPLGLALLPGGTQAPNRVARNYWEELGLRIAVFKPEIDLNDAFVRFFRLTRQQVTVTEFCKHLEEYGAELSASPAFMARCQMVASALEDPNLSQTVRATEPTERWTLWRAPLESSLSSGQRHEAKRRADASTRAAPRGVFVEIQTGENRNDGQRRKPEPPPPFGADWPSISSLPHHETWMDKTSELVRIVDAVRMAGVSWLDIAQWFRRAVEDPDILDAAEREEEEILRVAGLLWSSLPLADQYRELRLAVLKECWRVAARYRYPCTDDLYRCLTALHSYPSNDSAAEDIRPPSERALRAASAFLHEGEAQKALDEYINARRAADIESHPIAAWLAAEGVCAATYDSHTNLGKWPTREAIADVESEQDIRKKHPRVARWLDRAESMHSSLRIASIKRLQEKRREAGYEQHGWSFSTTPYKAWRFLRYLTDAGAPPPIRRWFLEPLLGGKYPFVDELRERIDLNMKGTGEWLGEEIEEISRTPSEKRASSEEAIVETIIRRPTATKTERVARIGCIPRIVELLKLRDLRQSIDFLQGADLDSEGTDSVGRAWRALSSICTWQDLSAPLSDHFRKVAGSRHEMSRRASELPWQHWCACDRFPDETGFVFLDLLVDANESPWSGGVSGWALSNVLEHSLQASSRSVDIALRWLNKVLSEPKCSPSVLEAAAAVICQLPKDSRKVNCLDELMRRAHGESGTVEKLEAIEALAVVSCRLLHDGTELDAARQFVSEALASVQRNWNDIATYLQNNPLHSSPFSWLLATAMEIEPASRAWTGSKLLEMTAWTWEVLPGFYRVLSNAFWGTQWTNLLDLLRMGGRQRDYKSWKLAVLDLWRAALACDNRVAELTTGSELAFLNFACLDSVADPDAVIANHAAYGIARFAEVVHTDDYQLSYVLKLMATDPRVGVRHGAAFAFARLKKGAAASSLRQLAEELDEKFSHDDTAVVVRQREYGASTARVSRC